MISGDPAETVRDSFWDTSIVLDAELVGGDPLDWLVFALPATDCEGVAVMGPGLAAESSVVRFPFRSQTMILFERPFLNFNPWAEIIGISHPDFFCAVDFPFLS